MECDQIQKMKLCWKSNQVVFFPYAILSCWPHSTAPPGSPLLKLNPDRIVKWSWLHPEQQSFIQPAIRRLIRNPRWGMCTSSKQQCRMWSFGLGPRAPGESSSAQPQHRQWKGTLFPHWCMLVKPRAVSKILLRLTNFPQFPKCKLTFSSHLFYFVPLSLGNLILLNTFL